MHVGSLFGFDNILDRMTCRACTTALLLVVMGIPGIAILVCLAIPLEFVERHSHYFFNGVLLWAIFLSIRVNLMYTFKIADEGLDSLAKTKRALSRVTVSLNGSHSSHSSLLLNHREDSMIDRQCVQIGSI